MIFTSTLNPTCERCTHWPAVAREAVAKQRALHPGLCPVGEGTCTQLVSGMALEVGFNFGCANHNPVPEETL